MTRSSVHMNIGHPGCLGICPTRATGRLLATMLAATALAAPCRGQIQANQAATFGPTPGGTGFQPAQATRPENNPPDVVRYSREPSVLLHHRWSGPAPAGVQMWISLDGRQWLPWHWSDRPAEPIAFTPPRQGRIRIALCPAATRLDEPPADLKETLSIVFDWDRPLLRLQSARRDVRLGQPLVQLTWAAWDEHFDQRPISLHWRPDASSPWQVGVAELPNGGAYEWIIPAEIATCRFDLCLRARDLAGNVSEAIVAVQPPPPATRPAEPAPPVASRPAEPAPFRSMEQAVPATQLAAADDAQRLWKLANQYAARADLASAEPLLRQALAADPAHVEARISLGNLLQRRGRHAEAVEHYEAALSIRPDHVLAWRNLALAHMAQKDYPRARTTLQKLLAIEPDNPQTWLDLGDVEMLAGRPAEARACWQKAKAAAPPFSEASTRADKRLAVYAKP